MALVANVQNPHLTKCHWCGRTMHKRDKLDGRFATRDHIRPRADWKWGPSERRNNIVWACRACNEVKGSMSYGTWVMFMKDNPNWWEKWVPHGASKEAEQ